ncbi:MAG: VOC family protein [Devosia sp.]
MSNDAKPTRVSLLPVLRYSDCTAALRFLTEVFGFTEGMSFRDDAGKVVHAELWFGNGGMMIGPVADTPFGKFMRQPGEAGGVTASLFLVVSDPDTHHARSQAAGFEILLPLRDEPYGSREYSVRDPEGHIWTFGTYDAAANKA